MPHVQFEINKQVKNSVKNRFADEIHAAFAEIMDTGTDHIAIKDLDIREGRTIKP